MRWIILPLLLLVACSAQGEETWMDASLTDVDGERFSISDFEGQTVFLESFALWCPVCQRQHTILEEFREGHDVVVVSLNTDPNENMEKVEEYVREHGYDWRFAVSPSNMTQELVNIYGTQIVSAPSVPVVMVCENQSTRMLKRGLKLESELERAIQEGC